MQIYTLPWATYARLMRCENPLSEKPYLHHFLLLTHISPFWRTYPSNDTSIEYWVRLVFLHLSLYNKPKVKNKKDRTFVAKPVRKGPILVNEAEISRYITETFEGVDV